jgi:hypothetical protein
MVSQWFESKLKNQFEGAIHTVLSWCFTLMSSKFAALPRASSGMWKSCEG